MWKEVGNNEFSIGKVEEKENSYIEVKKYKKITYQQQNEKQHMLEVNTTCDSHMVKRRKLRDISKLVRNGENETKLMFEKDSRSFWGKE